MSDPQSPNFKTGVGRLVTDRRHFQQHVDGYDFKHNADIIELSPPVTIDGYGTHTNIQSAINALAQVVNPPTVLISDASVFSKGIIQLAGDIGGTSTNIRVQRLQGHAVSNVAPSTNQVLTWNGSAWAPATAVSAFVASSDLSGTNISQTVVGLQGRAVANTAPTNNYVLTWVSANSRWEPAQLAPSGSGFVTVTSGAFDSSATSAIRYTGGKFQTDANLQFKNGSILGDLAWSPTVSNKTLTLPNITDTLVARTTTDTLTNKTINALDNTITDTSAEAGDLLVHNGTRFVRQAKGEEGTFWGISSGVAGYYTLPESGGGLSLPNTVAGNLVVTDGENGIMEGPVGETHGNVLQVQYAEGGAVLMFTQLQLHNPDSVSGVLEVLNGGTALSESDLIDQAGKVLSVRGDESGYEFISISSGSVNSIQVSDGYGALSSAANVLAGSGYISVGTNPAASGQIRLTGNTSNELINYLHDGNSYSAISINEDDRLVFGSTSYTPGVTLAGNYVDITSNVDLYITHGSRVTILDSDGIELGGPIGGSTINPNNPFMLKAATINIDGGLTSYSAVQTEYICPILVITGTGDGRSLILPNVANAVYIIANTSSGANFAVKVSGQTGITIAQNTTAIVRCNGTDYVRVTGNA